MQKVDSDSYLEEWLWPHTQKTDQPPVWQLKPGAIIFSGEEWEAGHFTPVANSLLCDWLGLSVHSCLFVCPLFSTQCFLDVISMLFIPPFPCLCYSLYLLFFFFFKESKTQQVTLCVQFKGDKFWAAYHCAAVIPEKKRQETTPEQV